MGLEGAVRLGYRKELAAIEDPNERKREFDERVARAYESGKAVNAGTGGGLDDVIDPAETRNVLGLSISAALNAPVRDDQPGFGIFRM